jgi:ATP-dependent DNA helicase RecQ
MSHSRLKPAPGLADAEVLLGLGFGHARFRPHQVPIIRAMLRGDDVLAVLPTGAGKSLCYQIPACLGQGVTLVISPLISLMEDQVQGLRMRGISAAALTSVTDPARRRRITAALLAGRYRLLYVSPERLETRSFLGLVQRLPVERVAVDEAHCISDWGHDFRPAYRRISRFVAEIGSPPTAAFTATATPATRTDIETCLGLRRPSRFVSSVDRPNLRWEAEQLPSFGTAVRLSMEALRRTLRQHPDSAAVLYLLTRARAVRTAEALRRLGVSAAPYHAGLPGDLRRRLQEDFRAGRCRAVCATSAFGMGIDHARIRLVCHIGIPGALEAYVQGAGRAGRDGEPARCLLMGLPEDRWLHQRLTRGQWPCGRSVATVWRAIPAAGSLPIQVLPRNLTGVMDRETVEAALRVLEERGWVRRTVAGSSRDSRVAAARLQRVLPPPSTTLELRRHLRRGRRRALRRLTAMQRYLEAGSCRREVIARYFGERAPVCGGCDNCRV